MPRMRIEGAKELSRVLKQLPRKMQGQAITGSLRAGARVIAADMKDRVPVDSGELRDSIAVRTKRGRVHVGFLRPASRRAHLVEYGAAHVRAQPFARPALDSKGPEAIRAIGKAMGKQIERLAKKLATSSFKKVRKSL